MDPLDPAFSVWVGKFSNSVTSSDLIEHFSQFGVVEKILMRENIYPPNTCFAIVLFQDKESVEKALVRSSQILGDEVVLVSQAKKRANKVYVGNVLPLVGLNAISSHFERFGKVVSIERPKNADGSLKEYSFIEFNDENCVLAAVDKEEHNIHKIKLIVNRTLKREEKKFLYEKAQKRAKNKVDEDPNGPSRTYIPYRKLTPYQKCRVDREKQEAEAREYFRRKREKRNQLDEEAPEEEDQNAETDELEENMIEKRDNIIKKDNAIVKEGEENMKREDIKNKNIKKENAEKGKLIKKGIEQEIPIETLSLYSPEPILPSDVTEWLNSNEGHPAIDLYDNAAALSMTAKCMAVPSYVGVNVEDKKIVLSNWIRPEKLNADDHIAPKVVTNRSRLLISKSEGQSDHNIEVGREMKKQYQTKKEKAFISNFPLTQKKNKIEPDDSKLNLQFRQSVECADKNRIKITSSYLYREALEKVKKQKESDAKVVNETPKIKRPSLSADGRKAIVEKYNQSNDKASKYSQEGQKQKDSSIIDEDVNKTEQKLQKSVAPILKKKDLLTHPDKSGKYRPPGLMASMGIDATLVPNANNSNFSALKPWSPQPTKPTEHSELTATKTSGIPKQKMDLYVREIDKCLRAIIIKARKSKNVKCAAIEDLKTEVVQIVGDIDDVESDEFINSMTPELEACFLEKEKKAKEDDK